MTVKGFRAMAQRMVNAEEKFVADIMALGGLSSEQAETVLAAYRKAKVVKMDAVGGTLTVRHGALLDRDVLRRNAGINE